MISDKLSNRVNNKRKGTLFSFSHYIKLIDNDFVNTESVSYLGYYYK